ncbi:MAG: hypothetical protein LC637_01360 [Xanthomonadaceae bacterium]|nr:hypothetical protein [Xanthomonadaceae bacterium]
MNLLQWALVPILLTAFSAASAQSPESFSSLEERMTGKEFAETGLDKLSADELASLNRWIRRRSLAAGEATGSGEQSLPDRPGELPSIASMAREPFQTRVIGKFTGWTGETEFSLENGMVWKQTGDGTFFIPEVENPTVTIRPGAIGTWRLSVEGYNSSTRVTRIR